MVLTSLLTLAQETAAADPESLNSVGRFFEQIMSEPGRLIRVALLLFIGLPIVFGVARWTRNWISHKATPQRGLVVGKLLGYVGVLLIFLGISYELGFNLTPLLGAAGVAGIAIGFASQTSISNVISGFFLIAEEPFVVGDVIQVGQTEGVVLSIDTISVKLRTFDNKFVRIPNETIVKSEVTTVTRFPVRRVDVLVGVAYKEDLDQVRKVLLDVANENPLCLTEPKPQIIFRGYGESSLDFKFAVWAKRETWLQLKTSIHEEIKRAFDAEGIEIPFPHRTLYTGAATEPMPIRIVNELGTPGEE